MQRSAPRDRKTVVFGSSWRNAESGRGISLLVNYFDIERAPLAIALDLIGDDGIFLCLVVIEVVARLNLHRLSRLAAYKYCMSGLRPEQRATASVSSHEL
jgi:hypothetical protein